MRSILVLGSAFPGARIVEHARTDLSGYARLAGRDFRGVEAGGDPAGGLCARCRGEGATLTHADWLGLLVDREVTHRRDKRLAARLRYARLRHHAVVEDVDYRAPRGLDRALFHKLAGGEWIDVHDNLILCGPTGVGKSWLACAPGHKACRDNRSVLYHRVPKLFADLALARGDGRYTRVMRSLNGAQLLILDDWGLEPLDGSARRDLYEILEERYGRRSTILTSQIPVDKWHEVIGEPMTS